MGVYVLEEGDNHKQHTTNLFALIDFRCGAAVAFFLAVLAMKTLRDKGAADQRQQEKDRFLALTFFVTAATQRRRC